MSLKTDYKDDILAVGNLRKYQMIQNNDGTVSFQDVTQYEQTGDVFGAGDINRTNQAVNEKFDSGDVVDPMLTTEPGFAADAYQTKLQFDEQNKNFAYSTKEVPIGTWVDGRTIYRKVYIGTTGNTVGVSIENNTKIKTIVKSYGQLKVIENGSICQLGCYLNANVYCGLYLAGGDINELQIYNSQQLTNSEYIVVVEYLKD